ncbi:MAG: TonB-dependent receptor [Sphingomonas sp.]|nr:TonB-dependent receptor [Sphingomonas sp.]
MTLQFRQRLLATTLLAGAGALATPAYAADSQPNTPGTSADTQSTVPDQNKATNPGDAPPTGPVEGQPTPTRNAQGAPVQGSQDIVVTGTRIPQPNLTSAAPITVVTNQDVKLSGATRVEDVLNSLPSVQANQSSGVSNGATGTAYVDLRDLGPKRTLVLINGRRLLPGDPNSTAQAADINFIPGALIKRVDVLTGGASSVYGADAVAGVVNFIMDTGFTGVRFDGQYGLYQHNNNCPSIPTSAANGGTVCGVLNARINSGLTGYSYPRGSVADGAQFDGTMSVGAAFDDSRGHAMAYFGYRKVNPVLQQRRDYSACALQGAGNITCGGSLTNRTGTVIFFTQTTAGGGATSTVGGLGAGTVGALGPRFNFNPTNYFQRPDERYTGGAFADFEISKAVHPYMEVMFMDDHTIAQIAPSGDFGNTFMVNCDNPLLSAQQRGVLCQPANLIVGFANGFPVASGASYAPALGFPLGTPAQTFFGPTGRTYNQAFAQILRRNVEGGNRQADLKHTEWRGVLGTRGDLGNVWSYDAYFQYGRTDYSQIYRNELSAQRLVNALNVVSVLNGVEVAPNTAGSVRTCRSVLSGTDVNCVPIDYFTGAGPSAAALNYVRATGLIQGTTSEQVADANITGALGDYGVQTPWSDEGVGVNFGAEYRKESLDLTPDQEFQTGDLTGQGAATLPVSGNYRVLEAFGEIQIPIIRHSFFEELSVAAGYRKSYYKLGTGRTYDTDTYKLSAEFAPVRDIRFRGAYNRAVRAPNIQELFAPQTVALDASTDPCAGHPIAATEFGCIAQGMTVGSQTPENPAEQYNGLIGGEPSLNPEKATTKTLGVVLQPRWIPRLAITADWYDIKVVNAIQPFGADAILSNCVTGSTSASNIAPSCALIHRAPGGSLWLSALGFVTDLPHNVGSVETRGVDGNISYSYRLGRIGTLSASAVGTWVDKYLTNDGLNPTYDCAGFYGATCGNPLPHWRHKARLGLQMPNGIGISAQWRYVGKVKHQGFSPDQVLNGGTPALNPRVAAQSYFDLASTFTVGDHYNFRLGVNNIFDKNPPLFTSNLGSCAVSTCNGNTYGGTYDTLGRFFFAGATLNF